MPSSFFERLSRRVREPRLGAVRATAPDRRRALSVGFAVAVGFAWLGLPNVQAEPQPDPPPGDAEPATPQTLPSPLKLGSIRVSDHDSRGVLEDGTPAELTLAPHFQHAAERLLKLAQPAAGAAILVDVETSKVLAFAQYTSPGHPIYDVLTSEAPSASVFKLVTTTSLFEHGAVDPDTVVCFSGGEDGIRRQHLSAPPAHGGRCAPFGTALGFSRNAVYAQLATEHLMRSDLAETAKRLGFNAALPFDVGARLGSVELPYNDLEFARAAAGFQNTSLSPVGAAHLTYAIALGGRAAPMHLVERAGHYSAPPHRVLSNSIMSPTTAWRLTRMMEVTVHSGTSLEAFSNSHGSSYLGSVRVAGKTGTLQIRKGSPTTSWFTGFAPSRSPRVVVTVMLQNERVWRRKANELARDLLRVYFKDRRGVTDPFEDPGG